MEGAFCKSTQQQIKADYPELKTADNCPGCGKKICFHNNEPHQAQRLGTSDFADAYMRGFADGNKRQRPDTDKTPAAHAITVLNGLRNRFIHLPVVEDEASFLSENELAGAQESIAGGKHERNLVAYMTPFLSERLLTSFPDHFILVNSEEYSWVPQSSDMKNQYLAPDQFICPHYLVRYRHPYLNAPQIVGGGNYGIFPVFSARESLGCILDAKTKISNEGIGGFMRYLEICSSRDVRSDLSVEVRGMLYDSTDVYLMTALGGLIGQVSHCHWNDRGSMNAITSYFEGHADCTWHIALTKACELLQCEVTSYSTATLEQQEHQQSILGMGAFGRVFEAIKDGEHFALKVVQGASDRAELQKEFEIINGLPNACADSIVGVVANSFVHSTVSMPNHEPLLVAAFLMPIIGKPFGHMDDVRGHEAAILESLSDLHAAMVIHGDARYKNVVFDVESNSFRWIDFRTRAVLTTVGMEEDVCTFLESLGRKVNDTALENYIQSFVNDNADASTRKALARLLWA